MPVLTRRHPHVTQGPPQADPGVDPGGSEFDALNTPPGPPGEPAGPPGGPSLAARIAWHRRELAALEQQQTDELLRLIASTFPGEVFTAVNVWQQPALRAACLDAEIQNPQQLGKWLRGEGVDRVGADHDGALWVCG